MTPRRTDQLELFAEIIETVASATSHSSDPDGAWGTRRLAPVGAAGAFFTIASTRPSGGVGRRSRGDARCTAGGRRR